MDQKDALTELASIVRRGGRVASTLGAVDVERLVAFEVIGHNVMAAPTADKLRLFEDLASSGALRVPIQGI